MYRNTDYGVQQAGNLLIQDGEVNTKARWHRGTRRRHQVGLPLATGFGAAGSCPAPEGWSSGCSSRSVAAPLRGNGPPPLPVRRSFTALTAAPPSAPAATMATPDLAPAAAPNGPATKPPTAAPTTETPRVVLVACTHAEDSWCCVADAQPAAASTALPAAAVTLPATAVRPPAALPQCVALRTGVASPAQSFPA